MGARELLAPLVRVPALKAAGRTAVRGAAMTTSRWRPAPDFLIIGAKRGGTTSMYRYLLDHPQMLPMFPSASILPLAEDMKGVHYFDTNWGKGNRWYHSHFASESARARRTQSVDGPAVTGESSPYYLFHPRAAERAAATVPDAKVIVMLRDPVERTFSHWKEQRRRSMEPLDLIAALDAEPDRLAGEELLLTRDDAAYSPVHEHQGYLRQSCYADGLSRWLETFDRDQILVVWSDEFYRDPQPVFDAACKHIGIASRIIADAKTWNAAPSESGLNSAVRDRLRAYFEGPDAQLRELLGTPLGWDS